MIEADAIALATRFLNERFGPNPMFFESRVGFQFVSAKYNSERGLSTFRHWRIEFDLIDLDTKRSVGFSHIVMVHAKTRQVCLFRELLEKDQLFDPSA